MLDDDELAVAAQARPRVNDLARSARHDGLTGFARDIDAFQVCRFGEARHDFSCRRPDPAEIVIVDFGNAARLGFGRRSRHRRRSGGDRARFRRWRPGRRGHRRLLLQLRKRLLRIRKLDRSRLGLEGRGVGAAAGRRRNHRGTHLTGARCHRRGSDQRRRRDAGLAAGRAEQQHLADADDVDVLDVVPCRELAVIEAVIKRDLVQRVAALDGVGRRCRDRLASGQPLGGRCWRHLPRRRKRPALDDRSRRPRHASGEQHRNGERGPERCKARAGAINHASPESSGTNLTASYVCSRMPPVAFSMTVSSCTPFSSSSWRASGSTIRPPTLR